MIKEEIIILYDKIRVSQYFAFFTIINKNRVVKTS